MDILKKLLIRNIFNIDNTYNNKKVLKKIHAFMG